MTEGPKIANLFEYRFVDRKTGKHISNRTLAKMARLCWLASADLRMQQSPKPKVGLGSLFPLLDADVQTKILLHRLSKRYRTVRIRSRGARHGGFHSEWQFYLLSDDGAKELLKVFFRYNHPRKMKLLFFCRWLATSVGDENHPAFHQIDQLCPALSVISPAPSTIRKLLSSEKPVLYYFLVPNKMFKKVAR